MVTDNRFEQTTLPESSLQVVHVHGVDRGAAVVMIPSAFGVASDLQEQMHELANEARLVVSFDPFQRADAGVIPYHDTQRVMARLATLDASQTERDVAALIAWARAHSGVTHVVLVGICFGGPFALRAAANGLVDGVVVWHGTRMEQTLSRASEMRCPMRIHMGGVDPFVPALAVNAVREAFANASHVVVHVHQGATHGFTHRAVKAAYDPAAESAAMASVYELIRTR